MNMKIIKALNFGKRYKIQVLFIGILFLGLTIFGGATYKGLILHGDKEAVVENQEGIVLGLTEASESAIVSSPSPIPTVKPKPVVKAVSITAPTPTPTPQQIQNTSPSTNNAPQTSTQPINTVQGQIPQSTSSDAYLDYLHQWQEENAKKQEMCSEWAKERDTALAPLKQAADTAAQRVRDEEASTDYNPQLSSVRNSLSKNRAVMLLVEASSKTSSEYRDAFNSYGTCPYR